MCISQKQKLVNLLADVLCDDEYIDRSSSLYYFAFKVKSVINNNNNKDLQENLFKFP